MNKKSSSRSNENCKELELGIVRCVHRFALRNHPSVPTFETSLRNAEQHRVFVSFIIVLIMGSIWILIRRQGNDENGNESIVSTCRSYRDYRSSPLIYFHFSRWCKINQTKINQTKFVIINTIKIEYFYVSAK